MKIDLKSALARRKMSQQSLADAIEVNKSFISELANGIKQPSIDTLGKILTALDADISELIPSRHPIAVAGRVGAGAKVDLVDAYAKGDGLYHVACPAELSPHGIVAVEVEGDSMAPYYLPGSVLFYSRDAIGVPTEALNLICVCEDTEGRAWVKQVKTGTEPGVFHLLSLNPSGINMHDVALKWAAPVRLSLPSEFVRKI